MPNTSTNCTTCKGNGGKFIKRYNEELQYEEELFQPCPECSPIEDAKKLFKSSQISEEFQQKSFDNFIVEGRPQTVIEARYCAVTYFKEFTDIQKTKHHSIAICGQPGSGKTHLLMAIANGLIKQNIAVLYFPWVEALNNLKNDFTKLDARIHRMQEVDVLYIDDLFKGRKEPTEFQLEQLFAVVNTRYLNKKPMLVSSEKTLDEIIKMDEGLGSRIHEMCRDYAVSMRGGQELNYRLHGDTE